MRPDYDSPWKTMLDRFLAEWLALLFPEIHAAVDWPRGFTSMDTALRRLGIAGKSSNLHVDKLFKVWERDGAERILYIHIEIQSARDAEFGRRLLFYWCRIYENLKLAPVTLAILADADPKWRPREFAVDRHGCKMRFRYPTVKLADFEGRRAELETSDNPAAMLLLAHLDTGATKDAPADRAVRKMALLKALLRRGVLSDEIRDQFRFIDWLMALPPELAEAHYNEWDILQKEYRMEFIPFFEKRPYERGIREGIELGKKEGIVEGLEMVLELKFGASGQRFAQKLHGVESLEKLAEIGKSLRAGAELKDLRKLLR